MPAQCAMTLVPSVPAAVRVMDVSEEGQMLLALLFRTPTRAPDAVTAAA